MNIKLRVLAILVLLAGASLITGARAPQSLAARPAAAATLTIGWDQNPDTINPAVTGARSVGPIDQTMFDTLVWLTPKGEITPYLATSWKASDQARTFTFNLR